MVNESGTESLVTTFPVGQKKAGASSASAITTVHLARGIPRSTHATRAMKSGGASVISERSIRRRSKRDTYVPISTTSRTA